MSTIYDVKDARGKLYTAGAGWDGSLKPLGQGMSTDDVMVEAGLDWLVEQRPIYTKQPTWASGTYGLTEVGTHVANVRRDTGAVIGVVGSGFVPAQNRRVLEVAAAIVDSGEARWLAAGTTRGGARVHAVMELERDVLIGGLEDERLLPLLRVENGHDGSRALTVRVAPMRLVCLNGMLVQHGVKGEWRARHTSGLSGEGWMDDARHSLRLASAYYDRLVEVSEDLLAVPMHAPDFERFLTALVPRPPLKDHAGTPNRTAENAERVKEAIRTCWKADDLANIAPTGYGAYQAVTAYVDHVARLNATPSRSISDARFERQVGSHKLKDRAYEILRLTDAQTLLRPAV